MSEVTSKVPRLRFPEFSGEWEEKKLGSIATFYNSRRVPLTESDRIKGSYPYYGASGVIDYVENYIFDGEYILLGEDGANIVLRNSRLVFLAKGRFWVNNHAHIFQAKESNYFLCETLERINYSKYNTGTAQPKLNSDVVKKIRFNQPALQEQVKIAAFLTEVDNKIEQLSKKKELLGEYKKGLMQQIFSQAIRFKADDGSEFPDWEEKKLGDLPIYISDGNYGELYPASEDFKPRGVAFLRANNIKNLKIDDTDTKYITEKQHSVLNSGHLLTNDILITTRGKLGNIALVDSKHNGSNINAQICLLRVSDNTQINYLYLLCILEHRDSKKQYKAFETGTALKQLPKGNLKKVNIKVPSLNEQTKIANFLSSIDIKIEQVVKQLDESKQFKKALLQQMFI